MPEFKKLHILIYALMMFCLIVGLGCLLIGTVLTILASGSENEKILPVGLRLLAIGGGTFVSSVTVWWFLFGFGQFVIDTHEALKQKGKVSDMTDDTQK